MEIVTAADDTELDAVLASGLRLIVAVENDGQLRHVMRRLVRLHAPAPSKRPDDLPRNRTIPDLPPIGILPLAPVDGDLTHRLGLPRTPAEVAEAVLAGRTTHLDLLRHDGGSVTLSSVLLGAADQQGAVPWRGRVEVDDAVLTDGEEDVVVVAVSNADGGTTLDGLPLTTSESAADGLIDVAVAVPVMHKPLLGKARMRFEVRRARGRAVAITPRDIELPFREDGVAGTLSRKRSWWIEPGAWAVYTRPGRN